MTYRWRLISLALLVGACTEPATDVGASEAALASPISSSVSLSAAANITSSDVSDSATVTDSAAAAQGAAVAPLVASVRAISTDGVSMMAQAEGSVVAVWDDASSGRVEWDATVALSNVLTDGVALVGSGSDAGWAYTFTADVTGNFTMEYDVRVHGELRPVDQFTFLWSGPGGGINLPAGSSGVLTRPIVAGTTYTVQLVNTTEMRAIGWAFRGSVLEGRFVWSMDTLRLVSPDVDIEPGSDSNPINTRSNGVIPVAVLGSADVDVTIVDVSSITFGPGRATPVHGGHFEDVDDDGDVDLVLHFRTQATALAPGDDTACVRAFTTGGIPVFGCDSVHTVP